MSPSYRNQSIDLLCKSMDWFLYDRDVSHERVNRSLDVGTFPSSMKLANVTPVYKKGSLSDKGNYRPASILPNLSKVF